MILCRQKCPLRRRRYSQVYDGKAVNCYQQPVFSDVSGKPGLLVHSATGRPVICESGRCRCGSEGGLGLDSSYTTEINRLHSDLPLLCFLHPFAILDNKKTLLDMKPAGQPKQPGCGE